MAYPNDVHFGDTGHVAYHNAEKNAIEDHKALTTGAHGGIVSETDARLTDSRTPLPHAATHGPTGTDPIPGGSTFTGGTVGADVQFPQATGPVLVDQTTGQLFRVAVNNGALTVVSLGATTGGGGTTGGGTSGGGGNAATPGISALVQIDDADSGTGDTFPVFTGAWTTASNAGDRGGTDRYVNAAASVTIPWTSGVNASSVGSTVTIRGSRASHHGIAAVSIDNGAETMVDLYASSRADGVSLWTSGTLAAGKHTVKWRWTGTKNAASTDSVINFDGADLTNAFPRSGGTPTVTSSGFVTRSGTNLISGSDTSWQFVMWNMAVSCGTGGYANGADTTCGLGSEVYSPSDLATLFSNMRQDGRQVIRTWAFGNYNVADIDTVLAIAAAHNIKVILTLGDSFGACGDSNTGAGGSGAGSGSNPINNNNDFFNGGWQNQYKANINRLVPRYKNHTEVLAWEVMNEPFNADNIVSAYGQITALIRSLDPNHLISSGTQPPWGFGADDASGLAKWKQIQSTCDIASMHEYDGGRSAFGGPFVAPSPHFSISLNGAHANNQPLMVGEFGLDAEPRLSQSTGSGGDGYGGSTRAQALGDKLTSYLSAGTDSGSGLSRAGVCGAGYWDLAKSVDGVGVGVDANGAEFTTLKNFSIPA